MQRRDEILCAGTTYVAEEGYSPVILTFFNCKRNDVSSFKRWKLSKHENSKIFFAASNCTVSHDGFARIWLVLARLRCQGY